MNYSIVFYIIGWILNFEAAFMVLPTVVALIYRESEVWCFLATMAVCLMVGMLLVRRKPKNQIFYVAESFVAVSLSWVLLSVMGAVPFVLSGYIPNPIDALFETVSGFTTTGASILSNVEQLPKCLLFWRSFTHWIGGMGVLVFVLAILPLAGGGYSMYLMRAESPGPSVGKLTPKVKNTAKILYLIYLVMTVLQMILLLIGGMPLFDSLATSFGTAGTGGFGIWNDSIAHYNSYYLQGVITVFMILFGVNFNVYYLLSIRKWKEALQCDEARVYFGIIACSILVITINIRAMFPTLFDAFHHAAFQVGTIITTTGFSTVDFDQWPELSKTILVGLMLVGACAGSTGGGMKVSRFIIWFKEIRKEIASLLHPRSVKVLKTEGKVIEPSVVSSVNAYFITYFFLYAASVLIVSLDNFDFTSNFTAVAATLNNIGPGLGAVGPTCNFGGFSILSKLVLMFDMLAGRLELFPMLLLFSPSTWKKI